MSSAFIPKEKLSAYQRWELHSFDAPATDTPFQEKERRAANDALLQAAREAAHREGFDAGYQSGAAEAASQAALFTRLAAECRVLTAQQDEAIAQDVLTLACVVARRLVSATLECDEAAVLPVIKDALNRVAHARTSGRVIIHPDDLPLVKARLGAELAAIGWTIAEDALLTRGGCRLECAAGDVDASVEHRWERLMETLGQPGTWLRSPSTEAGGS